MHLCHYPNCGKIYKKTSHLKEAIRRSWVPGSPDHRCPESSNGNTVLHVAARMGEAKVGAVVNRYFVRVNLVVNLGPGRGSTQLRCIYSY